MEATPTSTLIDGGAAAGDPLEQLTSLFGSYKAEWLRDRIYEFFTEPAYFPELTTSRPCILQGGRGTGKTTVLRCLSYQGQFALRGQSADFASWTYFGFYYRINTNRVTAFRGPELTEQEWQRYFGHYANLELCGLALDFLAWYEGKNPEAAHLSSDDCRGVAIALNLPTCNTEEELRSALREARGEFQAAVNNAADPERRSRKLSMQSDPIDKLLAAMSHLPQFNGKEFFFLLDEYENLLDYQQRIFNSLIKHAGEHYTFKVGVKELGLRVRGYTLNDHERLVSPADYVLLPISEKLGERFATFAASVCNDRLRRLTVENGAINDVAALFPGLSEEEEAEALGVRGKIDLVPRLRAEGADDLVPIVEPLAPLVQYFLGLWAETNHLSVTECVLDYFANTRDWLTRLGNYRHAVLFTIKRGQRGIRKYYCGWDTYVRLAAGNIRYLLELVEQSLIAHVRDGLLLGSRVAPDTQTVAAQAVGRKNLKELDGLSVQGAKLTKLLLGLGRVFQVMALHPEGHTPEANQFALNEEGAPDSDRQELVDALLNEAVMHLVLLRFPGSKLQDPGDTRAYDYQVHPIFSAFFEFSYRRKRKISLTADDILGFVETPRRAIREVLREQQRADDDSLPEQLGLFGDYYDRN